MGTNKDISKKSTKTSSATAATLNSPDGGRAAKGRSNGKEITRTGSSLDWVEPTPDETLLDDKELLRILIQVRNGNFTVRMPIDETGVKGKICDTLNEIISLN